MYTVLHIEHSNFFRKMVKNVLSNKGYNYICADDFITKPIDEELFIAKLRSNIRVYSMNKKFKEILKEIK